MHQLTLLVDDLTKRFSKITTTTAVNQKSEEVCIESNSTEAGMIYNHRSQLGKHLPPMALANRPQKQQFIVS